MRLGFLLPLLALSPLAVGCGVAAGPAPGGGGETTNDGCTDTGAMSSGVADEVEAGGIRRFSSEGELDAYVGAIEAKAKAAAEAEARCRKSSGQTTGEANAGAAAPAEAPSNETITNNQEAGVDEGGIVKNIGGSLVVLRKGRLFVVDVAGGAPTLTDSMRVARSDALNKSVWYDEMLVKGDLLYVVGYRYGVAAPGEQVRGATEIDTFRVANGKLVRLKSMFLESNDYYSGKNYASRMVGGKLVFYMPHYVGRGTDGKLAFPRVLEGKDDGTFGVVGPVFGALDVSTSLVKPGHATFHTVVQCDLPSTGELACHGRAVLGSWWREHYVSPDAVYLWSNAHVYRFDFTSLDVVAHKAQGAPLDQFSFRQSGGELFVATNAYESGGTQEAGVLSVPVAAFDKKGAQPTLSWRSFGPGSWMTKNRFVGDTLVAALGYGTGEVISVDARTGATSRLAAGHAVTRLEPIGEGRVLVVTNDGPSSMSLDAYATSDMTRSLGHLALAGVQEGEGRSHGFFYKPGEAGAGMFGYAVVAPPDRGAPYGYGNGISNIGFFDVAATGALGARGIVSSGTDVSQCEVSCVDWYGNTRPIFLGSRTFALMGSELAEVSLASGQATKGAAAALTWTE